MKKFNIVLLALFCFVLPLSSQNRGGANEEGAVETVDARRTVTMAGKQWVIIIGIGEYRVWEPLFYPVKDAQEIKKILLDNYYVDEIRELYNRDATAAAIRQLFVELQDNTGPNDSVFIFHAGHGVNSEKTKTSAWIPYDGGEDELDQDKWLSHKQIRSLLDSLKAKHVFLISDSCYAGDLLDQKRGLPEIIINYPAAYDKKSRQAMCSGASEKVKDESEFASRLKNILLRTEAAYITPEYLWSQIKEAQTTRPLYTQPILALIPETDHYLGGSFLFFRKNPRQNVKIQPNSLHETSIPPAVVVKPALPDKQGVPGEYEYFIGSWTATVEHNNSFDTYYLNLYANGRCTVKIVNDIVAQETTGNWSWDGSIFKLSALFRNPPINYQQNIQWVSLVSYGGGNNAFSILGRAATNGSPVRFSFFRD